MTTYFCDSLIVIKLNYVNRPWIFCFLALPHFLPPLSTLQLLSRKDKATFDRLDYLMSKEDNYKRLRDFISSQSMVSCIPYLGRMHVHKRTHTHKPLMARSLKDAWLPLRHTFKSYTCEPEGL